MKKRFFFVPVVLLCSLFIVPLMLCAGLIAPLEIPFYLLTGWLFFLRQTLPEVTVDGPAIGLSLVALLLLAVGIHRVGRSWLNRSSSDNAAALPTAPKRWKLRWTASLMTVLLLSFTAGISVVGAVHQLMWIAFSKEAFATNSFDAVVGSTESQNNMRRLGTAIHNYHQARQSFPPGGTVDDRGRPMHSWVTHLLPYMEHTRLYESIDLNVPWSDPSNSGEFATALPELTIKRAAAKQTHNADGYAVTHYAANQRVLGFSRTITYDDVTDGLSQTLIIGEVNRRLRAWGDPLNLRDPTIGLNSSEDGFGSPFNGSREDSVNFLLGDGSVRTVSADIDPKTLRAISTPGGGELVGEF